ncbi:MAG: hypothetical protein KBC42_01595 [Candidatus Pacebacteria bacterium]|nr:hypothetical protein [Candidatus Paceibacterota bacterium]MBP9780599.1 hypothetical protein [Candidatus Paceibacterota bacterium]
MQTTENKKREVDHFVDPHYPQFNHQRHAEKLLLTNGKAVVKITKVTRPNKGQVCVHLFNNSHFNCIEITRYDTEALHFWAECCEDVKDTNPESLTKAEFGKVQYKAQVANSLDVFLLRKKAEHIERKFKM